MPQGRGSVAGRKILAPPYSQRAVFASLRALFSLISVAVSDALCGLGSVHYSLSVKWQLCVFTLSWALLCAYQVYARPEWSRRRPPGGVWTCGHVTVSCTQPLQLVLVAEFGHVFTGVAIDDVSITPGHCHSSNMSLWSSNWVCLYLSHRGSVFGVVCLFVCFFVSSIMQKLLHWFFLNLVERWHMVHWMNR